MHYTQIRGALICAVYFGLALSLASADPPVSHSGSDSSGSGTTPGPAITDSNHKSLRMPPPTGSQKPASIEASRADQIVRTALSYRGSPYRRGGESSVSGFDCSGLVQAVCAKWGVYLPRVASEQLSKGRGKRVLPYELRPGDLVFFSDTYRRGTSHVGIYIGDGQMIHAATPTQGVIVSDLTDSYLRQHYCGALRLDLTKLDPAHQSRTGRTPRALPTGALTGMAGASIDITKTTPGVKPDPTQYDELAAAMTGTDVLTAATNEGGSVPYTATPTLGPVGVEIPQLN